MQVKWRNGVLYSCRKIGVYPAVYVERVMHGKYKGISLQFFEEQGKEETTISMTNRLARILAQRITQALYHDRRKQCK